MPAGTSKENNDGLKWLTLHPKFADNKLVYFSYPLSGERGTFGRAPSLVPPHQVLGVLARQIRALQSRRL